MVTAESLDPVPSLVAARPLQKVYWGYKALNIRQKLLMPQDALVGSQNFCQKVISLKEF